MTYNDPIASVLTTIRNGQRFQKIDVLHFKSKLVCNLLDILIKEGYIAGYANFVKQNINYLKIFLKYNPNGEPIIQHIVRVSKPGRRLYYKISKLQTFKNSLGIYILSTSKGLMSDYDARQQNIGGEVLCKIF